jgi:hypothetical protein
MNRTVPVSQPNDKGLIMIETMQENILRFGIPAAVVLLLAMFGLLLLRETTIDAEAAHVATYYSAEQAGAITAGFTKCRMNIPTPYSRAFDIAAKKSYADYKRGYDGIYNNMFSPNCHKLEKDFT